MNSKSILFISVFIVSRIHSAEECDYLQSHQLRANRSPQHSMELVQRDSSDFDQEITGPGLPHLGTKGEVLVLANQHEKAVAPPGDPRVHSEVGHAFCRPRESLEVFCLLFPINGGALLRPSWYNDRDGPELTLSLISADPARIGVTSFVLVDDASLALDRSNLKACDSGHLRLGEQLAGVVWQRAQPRRL